MPRPFPPRRDDFQQPRRRRQRATPSGDRSSLPADLKSAERGVRLQKALADAGVAARRDCEELILQGRVKVNGVIVAAMPAWVDPSRDRIEVDGQPLQRVKSVEVGHEKIYVLLNKPRGVITTTNDPEARQTVNDLVILPNNIRARLFPVGRLDADSNGLILMTNDGELANRLTHPRYGVPKQYAVSIRGRLTQEDITTLKEGIHLAHLSHDNDDSPVVKRASMANVELVGYGTDRNSNERTRLLVTLREGQNREIRRMIAHLGYKVRRLERVSIGPLTTKGLGVGQWRFLTTKEVNQLQRLGEKVAAAPARGTQAALDTSSEEVHLPRPRLSAARKPFQPRNPREPRKPRQQRGQQGEAFRPRDTEAGSDRPRRPRSEGDRPRFEDGDRPRRPRASGDRPNFEGGERPRRPRFEGERPRFEDGDRPRRPRASGDRPNFEGGDRPRRPRFEGERPRFEDGDRPRRPRASGDRPNFEGGDRPRRPRPTGDRPNFEGGDRPRRPRPTGDRPNFEGGDRPRRPRPTGDRPNFEGGDRPRRPRGDGDRPRGPRNDGPRDGGPRKGPRGGGKGGRRR